jgi:Cof subfamily protein (haloacid dehalogenase superfamily)
MPKKLKYPLIISDFDGTLVNDDGTISQENKNAIAKYVQDGGVFAISTGRMHYGILPRARELGLKGVISCCQGALIMDIETQNILQDGTFSNEKTVEICEIMEELGLHIHLYAFDDYYVNMDDEALKNYERAVRRKGKLVLDKPLSKYAKEKQLCAYKLLAMVPPNETGEVIESLKERNMQGCIVTKSAPFLVEVINEKYSKGTAVDFLAKHYGVAIENTIGIGDQWNDVPMIEAAGLGIAVKNADEQLKKCAVTVDYTNEESAVGKIIEKYGYQYD